MLISASPLGAQDVSRGPTIAAARAGFAPPSTATFEAAELFVATSHCGSVIKNAALLGLGISLAVGVIELTYTIIREPLVRNGHDLPRADPMIIAWAGGAGFVIGLVGTELCRRRHR
jgi:hypothetical protein